MPTQRARQPMPDDVARLLREHGIEAAYAARPPYQRSDYLGWIARAEREATRQKRPAQRLDALERGKVYMNMKWTDR